MFGKAPFLGNPLAVVLDAEGIDEETMARIARWTNLSETTFVLPPTTDAADYRVRIWTPFGELPFAGHPTLGTCWAWRVDGGVSKQSGTTVQECTAGLITVRDDGGRLAFAAPPLVRSGPVEPDLVADVIDAMQLDPSDVEDSQWVDNGPGWMAVLLRSADAVRAARPRRLADEGRPGRTRRPGARRGRPSLRSRRILGQVSVPVLVRIIDLSHHREARFSTTRPLSGRSSGVWATITEHDGHPAILRLAGTIASASDEWFVPSGRLSQGPPRGPWRVARSASCLRTAFAR